MSRKPAEILVGLEVIKREFPRQPVVGVGGVVIRGDQVLLIRRGSEPLKGEWSLPGGMLELGEELTQGVQREIEEETGLRVEPLGVIAVFDRIQLNGRPGDRAQGGSPKRRVRYHYVIIDYACRRKGGRLRPASDCLDAKWVHREELGAYGLTPTAAAVIKDAFAFTRRRGLLAYRANLHRRLLTPSRDGIPGNTTLKARTRTRMR